MKEAIAARWVCAVEIENAGPGTGFLIGSKYVLTNYHVAKPLVEEDLETKKAFCRFDYSGPKQDERGITYRVCDLLPVYSEPAMADAGEAETNFGDFLDFAILVLEQEIDGDLDDRGRGLGRRGYCPIFSDQAPPRIDQDVLLLQHPCRGELDPGQLPQLPLQSSRGRIEALPDGGRRARHTAETFKGSSGSPVFASDPFRVVALHNSGERSWRRAVPISAIAARIDKEDSEVAKKLLRRPEAAVPDGQARAAAEARKIAAARRRDAAILLMDRDVEELRFVSLVAPPIAVKKGPAASRPLMHVVFTRESADRFADFEARLRQLSLAVRNEESLLRRMAALNGESGIKAWGSLPGTWPPFDLDPDERLDVLKLWLSQHPGTGNYLAVASARIDDRFNVERERKLVAELARFAGEDCGLGPDSLQVLVNFYRDGHDGASTTASPASFDLLWKRGEAPPFCGFCASFGDIGFDQLGAWLRHLENAWGRPPPEFTAAVTSVFPIGGRVSLDSLRRALEPELTSYVLAVLSESPSGGKQP